MFNDLLFFIAVIITKFDKELFKIKFFSSFEYVVMEPLKKLIHILRYRAEVLVYVRFDWMLHIFKLSETCLNQILSKVVLY